MPIAARSITWSTPSRRSATVALCLRNRPYSWLSQRVVQLLTRPERLDQLLGPTAADARRIIEDMQAWAGSSYTLDPTWVLHELDRAGKHRVLPLVTGVFEGFEVLPGPYEVNLNKVTAGAIVDGVDLGFCIVTPNSVDDQRPPIRAAHKVEILVEGMPALQGTTIRALMALEHAETALRDELFAEQSPS